MTQKKIKWLGKLKGEELRFNMNDFDFKDLILKKNIKFSNGIKIKCDIQTRRKMNEKGDIINGAKSEVFASLLAQINPGTRFCADKDVIKAKKHWLKHTLKSQGRITLDSGAVNALVNKGASLLPAGIKLIESEFQAGECVDLIDHKNNRLIGKGICLYNHSDLQRIIGKHSDDIANILGHNQSDVVVHRDDMVIL